MQLGWVDFSQKDKNIMMNVLKLLHTPGAVDEIGIGVVRDAFANKFFPGTSTIQTRAKYFVLVPYIFQDIFSAQIKTDVDPIDILSLKEKHIGELLLAGVTSDEEDAEENEQLGIIGSRTLARNKRTGENNWVARAPSDIYWNGLKTYEIYRGNTTFSVSQALKVLKSETINKKKETGKRSSGKNSDSDDNSIESSSVYWDMSFSDNNENYVLNGNDYTKNISIELTNSEAKFLKYKILNSNPNSVMAYILKNNIKLDKFFTTNKIFEAFSTSSQLNKLDSDNKKLIQLANNFNELVFRLRVRYNVELFDGKYEYANELWDELRDKDYPFVDIEEIFLKLGISDSYLNLKTFLIKSEQLLHKNPSKSDLEKVKEFLLDQEIDIKGEGRAKLKQKKTLIPDSPYLVGGAWLDYRLSSAKRIIDDIYTGMKNV